MKRRSRKKRVAQQTTSAMTPWVTVLKVLTLKIRL
jgi:hypothetical protein